MIDPDLIVPLTLTILPIAIGFSLLIFFVARWEQKEKLNKTDKEPAKEPTETFDNDDDFELPLPDVVSARVIKKRVGGIHSGGKVSHYSVHFWITFMTDNGEELEFEVSQELFDKTAEGQTASLVTINGTFLDFGEGEDVAEKERANV